MTNGGLDQCIKERTAELVISNEALRREVTERKRVEQQLRLAMRARDEFLSIASHELRTPVTPLKLHLQSLVSLMRDGSLVSLPTARMEKMANSIERSIQRLGKLIDRLLDVTRIHHGKIDIEAHEIDVGQTLCELCNQIVLAHQSNPAS